MNSDSKVVLMALQKEREELHGKLMQIDRIIKKIRGGLFDEPQEAQIITIAEHVQLPTVANNTFSTDANIKVQVLRVFDIVGKASSLSAYQKEYARQSGNKYVIRDVMRSLQKAGLLKICREKTATRGHLWIKADWIENGQLAEQYKPDGFDMFYKPDNIVFE